MKKRKTRKKTKARTRTKSKPLGKVTHYFGKIDVAAIKLSQSLKVGDLIKFQTHEGVFTQLVESLQVNHKDIMGARKGLEIGLKVRQKVKEGDLVVFAPIQKPKPIFTEKPISKPLALIQSGLHLPVQSQPQNLLQPQSKPESPTPPQKKKPSGYSSVKFLKF